MSGTEGAEPPKTLLEEEGRPSTAGKASNKSGGSRPGSAAQNSAAGSGGLNGSRQGSRAGTPPSSDKTTTGTGRAAEQGVEHDLAQEAGQEEKGGEEGVAGENKQEQQESKEEEKAPSENNSDEAAARALAAGPPGGGKKMERRSSLLAEALSKAQEEDESPFADYDESGELYLDLDIRNRYSFAPFELSDFARAFKLVDVMGDRQLLPEQVDQAMNSIGQGQDEKDFEWAINTTDPDGKGLWDFQRFIDVMALFRKPPLTEVELRETFDLMDRDGGGSVSADELRMLMMCVGNSLSIEEAEDMIAIADADCSGEIEFHSFCRFIYAGAV
ncbi:unnamed protein product [Amoebophrya sp. A25]|nr:unnamed protein product [Amoebophrya sp. A25]|eukprot:GSA25T00003945001.1